MGFTETAAYFKERFALPDSLEAIKAPGVTMAEPKYCHRDSLKKGGAGVFRLFKREGDPRCHLFQQ